MTKQKSLSVFLLLVFLTQACMQVKMDAVKTPTAQKPALSTATKVPPTRTPTRIIPTDTQVIPTMTPVPQVTITAIKGNLYIRRGPDMAYNSIGVLYKGTTVKALMRDVLSKWVQIVTPKSSEKGWISLMTEYSKVEGVVDSLPQFKVTDWPVAGYVRNCTEHRMILYPGGIYIEAVTGRPENMIWVNPGVYMVFDLDMPDPTQIDDIEIREGLTVDIRYDGNGDKRKCPIP